MYKTTWIVKDLTTNITNELVLYHLGKEPKFPVQYLKENRAYEVEMIWNFKINPTLNLFIKCLIPQCEIR